MLKFAFRNLSRHKLRTALTLGAIAFGVISLVLSGGFVEDIFIQLRESTVQTGLGHVQIAKEGYFEYRSRQPYGYMVENPRQVVAAIKGMPAVKEAMLRVNLTGSLSNGRGELPVLGEGVEPQKEQAVGGFITLIDGRRLGADDRFAAELGEGLARALGVKPGDFVTLLLATAEGAMNSVELEVVGVFRSFSIDYDARAMRLPLATAQEALAVSAVHTVVVALHRTEDTPAVLAELRHTFGGQGLAIRSWEELADFYRKTVDMYRAQFGVLQLIILVMVALSVSNSVNINIFERTGEIGTLLALGNRRRDVFWLLVLENFLSGLLGSVLGAAAGVGLAQLISAIGIPMPPPPNSNVGYLALVRVVPVAVLQALAIGLVAAVCAALLPAARVSRLPIVEALRRI
ncbi:putative ABC transport system permease protein [Plasticicumulans lactativorans]|uniref:Putative ABC transport system permease protein n=1 Tax=Plasticicumulans lactativorans TaxID=1133106 RepID=A0A4R2L7D9_9GAMM|nr:FtsX-like permease family protein [Plasticicumulans lactativorans]TCO83409.1 putative ABC transport system permease protein [Plasticicumulans lactativorans]